MIDVILSRRSVRSGYDGKPIPRAALEAIIGCAMAAPSSKNAKPWTLHVVADGERLRRLAHAAETASGVDQYVPIDPATGQARSDWQSTVAESAAVLREVSAGIFIENRGPFSGGRATVAAAERAVLPNALVGYAFELVGLGAAIENMWLAAISFGLAAAYIGDILIAEDLIKKDLGMSGDLVGVLVLGYSTQQDHNVRPTQASVVYHDRLDT